jgi:hypothetical protein
MATQPRLSTPERIRRAAHDAIAAADDMEIQSETTLRVEMLIGRVEQASMDMRVAVRGPSR